MQSEQFYEFDFSISFASQDRPIAKELAEKLARRGVVIFYDAFYKSRLVGKRLDKEFIWIFGEGTRFFVPIVSHNYVERAWPQLEWTIAIKEAQKREPDFILPLRLDDAILFGISENVGYLDLSEYSIDEIVDILFQKYRDEVGFKAAYLKTETWIATFGLIVDDVLLSDILPEGVPQDYARLSDWLENDLIVRLQKASINNPRFTEPSERNGETLSVRVAFEWIPHQDALNFGNLQWWEVLEILPYHHIYKEPV